MFLVQGAFLILVLVSSILIVLLMLRPSLTTERPGMIVAFVAFFLLPVLITAIGTSAHLEQSKSTEFCLSCHVMEPYGRTLYIDDPDYVPASHFQNNRLPREAACFSCHTTYTMFGDFQAKLRGVRHLYVYYLGTAPENFKLYQPYDNRECLHCHADARSFEESDIHAVFLGELKANETSCLECHDLIHNVSDLGTLNMWEKEEE